MVPFALLIAGALERAAIVASNGPSPRAPRSRFHPAAERFKNVLSTGLIRHYSGTCKAGVSETCVTEGTEVMDWEATLYLHSADAEESARPPAQCEVRGHLVIEHAGDADLTPFLDSFDKLSRSAAPDRLFIGTPTNDAADCLERMALLARDRADGIHFAALPIVATWNAPRPPVARIWVLERGQWLGIS